MNRIFQISKAVYGKYYEDLGETEILDDVTIEEMKIKVTPHEGFHKKKEYRITLKFKENDWPLVFVDSELFDKIKTPQYNQNKGKVGSHKGICIKRLGHGYAFHTNFKKLCDNKWENYIYYLISLFNNIQDFEKGIGFKSNYKEILDIE
jgi:hypothetical protein